MTLDRSILQRQSQYWALHCCINALPSLIIACCYLGLWQNPLAIIAMLLAILTFIVAYTLVTSIEGLFSDPASLLSRSMKVGVKIRMWVSLISLPLLFPSPLIMLLPDFWAGMLASTLVNGIWQTVFGSQGMMDVSGGDPSMIAVFATTVLEGLILSFMLLMLSFFTLLILQMRARSKPPEIVLPPDH